jgi:hypothetical protein
MSSVQTSGFGAWPSPPGSSPSAGNREPLRQHADRRSGLRVDGDHAVGKSDHRQAPPPQVVANEDGAAARAVNLRKRATVHRLDTERVKIAADANPCHALRFAAARDVHAFGRIQASSRRSVAGDEVRHIARRRRQAIETDAAMDLRTVGPGHDQSIRVPARQRSKENRIDHAENRRVRANAERQRHDGDDRKSRLARQPSSASQSPACVVRPACAGPSHGSIPRSLRPSAESFV